MTIPADEIAWVRECYKAGDTLAEICEWGGYDPAEVAPLVDPLMLMPECARPVVELRLQGYSSAAAARALGVKVSAAHWYGWEYRKLPGAKPFPHPTIKLERRPTPYRNARRDRIMRTLVDKCGHAQVTVAAIFGTTRTTVRKGVRKQRELHAL